MAGSRRVPFALALARRRSVWSAVWLGFVCFATVFWANLAFAQGTSDPRYPDGGRHAAHWYYCYASRTNSSATAPTNAWSEIECQKILWQTGRSVSMVGGAFASNTVVRYAELVAYVVPPRYISTFEYRCQASTTATRTTGVESAEIRNTNHSSLFFETSNWLVTSMAATGTPSDADSIDVVDGWEGNGSDVWWTNDIVVSWTSSGTNNGTGWRVISVATGTGTAEGNFDCWILDWTMEDGQDLWEPAEGDLEATPVPTPWGGFGTVTPLLPISNTVDIVIGQPGTPECTTIVPGNAISETVFGYEVDAGWADYEVCAQPTVFTFEYFGVDFTGYLLLGFAMASIGIVYKFFRTG